MVSEFMMCICSCKCSCKTVGLFTKKAAAFLSDSPILKIIHSYASGLMVSFL